MKVAFGCDHGGYAVREKIFQYLQDKGIEYIDCGTGSDASTDYAAYAVKVCEKVQDGSADFGILICGTGIGMSIAANKMKGIRCAHVEDTFSAKSSRGHNDANVIALGARVTGPGLMLDILNLFLHTPFSNDERHVRRLSQVTALESKWGN